MVEIRPGDEIPPVRKGFPGPNEASDKPETADATTVNALQEEIIRIRNDSFKFVVKGAPPSEVADKDNRGYSSLVASLHTAATDSRDKASQTTAAPRTGDATHDSEVMASVHANALSIPLSQQDNLIAIRPNPEVADQTKQPLARNPESTPVAPAFQGNFMISNEVATAVPELRPLAKATPEVQIASANTSPRDNLITGTPIIASRGQVDNAPHYRQAAPATEQYSPRAESAPMNSGTIAQVPPQKAPMNEFYKVGGVTSPSASDPVIASNVQVRDFRPSQSPNIIAPETIAAAQTPNSGVKPATADTNVRADKPVTASSGSQNMVASENTSAQMNTKQSVAQSSSSDSPKIAMTPDRTYTPTNSETASRPALDRLAMNPVADSPYGKAQNSGINPMASQINERTTSSNAPTDDTSVSARDSSQQKPKDLQWQSPVNYPKYGGATPTEERSKQEIPQVRFNPQPTTLARDALSEKPLPLSTEIVSGKIVSQLGAPTDKLTPGTIKDLVPSDPKSYGLRFVDTKLAEAQVGEITNLKAPLGSASNKSDASQINQPLTPAERSALQGAPQGILQPGKFTPVAESTVPGKATEPAGRTEPGQSEVPNQDKSGKRPTGQAADSKDDKDTLIATAKGPGTAPVDATGKGPTGTKGLSDFMDFIDRMDGTGGLNPGIKGNIPIGPSNILSPDDILITGTGAINHVGNVPDKTDSDDDDDTSENIQLSQRRRKYIVEDGDTLESIAGKQLGDGRYSALILTINQATIPVRKIRGKQVATLNTGQELWLPSDHEMQIHAKLYFLEKKQKSEN